MKNLLFVLLITASVSAQSATRSVVLTWQPSTSSSVTGYALFRCSVVSPATSCTPSVTGTPLASVSGTTYSDAVAVGSSYSYSVVAVAPACTSTTPITTPCGNSAPASTTVPVPPQAGGVSNIVVVVP